VVYATDIDRDADAMTINVKYLSEQQIECDALGLLEAYFHEQGELIQVPIPADGQLPDLTSFGVKVSRHIFPDIVANPNSWVSISWPLRGIAPSSI
jgi:hypothetical protein